MWFIFALASTVFSGLQSFMNKVSIEHGCDTYYIAALSSCVSLLFSLALLAFSPGSLWSMPTMLVYLALASGVLYLGRVITQLEALQYIHAAIFFPLYKVIGPALVTFIGVLLLRDHVSLTALIGIILSCCVPLLLITHAEGKRQKNLRLGVVLLVASTLFAAVNTILNSYAVKPYESLTIPFMIIGIAFGSVIAIGIYVQRHPWATLPEQIRAHTTPSALWVALGLGLFQTASFYFLLRAFAEGSVSIVYSVSAHYILIPVLLSVWLYGEHWNKQKAFALCVSIIALVLLH